MSIDLPTVAGPDRESAILDRVRQGNYDDISWSPVTSQHEGHTATFEVFSDALKMDGVRINACADTEQKIADLLDCMLLTPKIADLIWSQRETTLVPSPQTISDTTAAMVAHSERIDGALNKLGGAKGLISTVGKHWVLDNDILDHPGFVENYGWHFEGVAFEGIVGEVNASLIKDDDGRFVRVIQGRGWRHNKEHVDYSQIVVLVSATCVVDGQSMKLSDVLQNEELAPLASHNGPLKLLRLPGVATSD